MVVGIIEFRIRAGQEARYAEFAETLHASIQRIEGFISVERFEGRSQPGKLLSLSFWRDAESLARWRAAPDHRKAMAAGKAEIFDDYRIVVADVARDYAFRRGA